MNLQIVSDEGFSVEAALPLEPDSILTQSHLFCRLHLGVVATPLPEVGLVEVRVLCRGPNGQTTLGALQQFESFEYVSGGIALLLDLSPLIQDLSGTCSADQFVVQLRGVGFGLTTGDFEGESDDTVQLVK
ncbi:MAG: hypothetical protein H7A46_26910 [Verrucomicrobiales bacterium]|nr:hypothetical protein [Verrucomicrobiales bacterium]